jgi:nucleoside-diphosphate-sugar epimerase
MKIGIIGTGNIGGTLVRKLRASGHEVRVANSRGPEFLSDLAAETGATAVTSAEVAAGVGALGLAIFSAIATVRSNHLFAAHVSLPRALDSGYSRALTAASIFVASSALIALCTRSQRGEAQPVLEAVPDLG